MKTLLLINLSMFWLVILIMLALLSRVFCWIRATNNAQIVEQDDTEIKKLIIGSPAPDFKARTLASQAVRLNDFEGRSVAFIFVSPACSHCRMEMPMFLKLAPLAKKNADVEIILVSDWGPGVTQQWLDAIRIEDNVNMTLPVLVAPTQKSDFLNDYNAGQMTPGFCLLGADGNVQAKGHIPSNEWNKLKRTWDGVMRLLPLTSSQYR